MNPSAPLTVYIAASAGRNLHAYLLLRDRLLEAGHSVLDWSRLPDFPLPSDLPAAERLAAANSDAYGKVFDFCRDAACTADLVIYLGPAGQDAAGEVCMAFTAGVRTMGLRGAFEAPGTILHRAVETWFQQPDDLLRAVERLAEEKAATGLV